MEVRMVERMEVRRGWVTVTMVRKLILFIVSLGVFLLSLGTLLLSLYVFYQADVAGIRPFVIIGGLVICRDTVIMIIMIIIFIFCRDTVIMIIIYRYNVIKIIKIFTCHDIVSESSSAINTTISHTTVIIIMKLSLMAVFLILIIITHHCHLTCHDHHDHPPGPVLIGGGVITLLCSLEVMIMITQTSSPP